MPSYSYVSWQPDDEVTSSKLKQMADNEQTIFETMLVGDLTYRLGVNNLLPAGRTVGSEQAERVEGYYVPFNNDPASPRYTVTIVYNTVFTFPPIVTVSVKAGSTSDLCVQLVEDSSLTQATAIVFKRDGSSAVFSGALNVIAIGR